MAYWLNRWLAASLCLLPSICWSLETEIVGNVQFVRTHASGAFGADIDWFSLEDVTSAGTCGTHSGRLVFRIKDDAKGQRMFALLLSAKASGTPVRVAINDAYKDVSGYCFAVFVN